MHKIIAIAALFTLVILVYLLFNQQTNSIIDKNKKQVNHNTNEKLLPIINKPLSKAQVEKPQSHPINPPALPTKQKPVDKEKPQLTHADQDPTYSYSIEDAEFYFIPSEQRYPGNIGGPPPLALPGSPLNP